MFLLLLLPFTSNSQSITKYYKYAENFNYPIYARFWGELTKEQLSDIKGRHFEVTYEIDNSSKRLYRMSRIVHKYLNEKQGIYEYSKTEFSGQQIEFGTASEVILKYNRYDQLEEVLFLDKLGNPCLNSYGSGKYEYKPDTYRDQYIEIRYSIDSEKRYVKREFPNSNELIFTLKHEAVSFEGKKWRLWKQIHCPELTKSYDFDNYLRNRSSILETRRTTTYYHSSSNIRRIDNDGCYELIETFGGKHGFLKECHRRDIKNKIIGIKEFFDLDEIDGVYEYTCRYENEKGDSEGFYDGNQYSEIKFDEKFHKISALKFNEEKMYIPEKSKIMESRWLPKGKNKEKYRVFRQKYNNGLLIEQTLLDSEGNKSNNQNYKYTTPQIWIFWCFKNWYSKIWTKEVRQE